MMVRGQWANLARVTPLLFFKGHAGIFNDHRESGPRFNVSSERRKFLSVRYVCQMWHWSNSNWIFSFNISGIIYSVKCSTVENIYFYNIIVFNATLLSIKTIFYFLYCRPQTGRWWLVHCIIIIISVSYYNSLQIHQDLREELAKAKNVAGIAEVNRQLKQRCQVKEL